jgi:glycosyltransferase involved in cell wall biosynthesis
MSFREASIIILPAYNAEPFLLATLNPLLAMVPAEKIIVVDDGSTDKTGEVALATGVTCLRHDKNQGKGTALMTGLLFALEKGWSWAVTMDVDGQHSPQDLPAFWNAPVAEDTAILVGRRAMLGSSMPAHRRFSNYLTTRMISSLARRPVFDAQCGFRMYRLGTIGPAGLPRQGRFEWEAQALILSCRKGYSLLPVDINTVYTDNGTHMRLVRDTFRFLKMYGRMSWTQ